MNILTELTKVQDYLNSIGLQFSHNVSLMPIVERNSMIKIEIRMNNADTEYLKKAIQVKDTNNISDKANQSFRNLGLSSLPSLRQIKLERKLLNKTFNIKQTVHGVYLSLEEKISILLPNIISNKFHRSNHQ